MNFDKVGFFSNLRYLEMEETEWLNKITDPIKGMLVTHPGMHPGALRVDQLDREQDDKNVIKYPQIVHFGTRPQQLCYAGNAEYQKVWREYIKFRHLLANMPKPTFKVNIEFFSKYLFLNKKISESKTQFLFFYKRYCNALHTRLYQF